MCDVLHYSIFQTKSMCDLFKTTGVHLKLRNKRFEIRISGETTGTMERWPLFFSQWTVTFLFFLLSHSLFLSFCFPMAPLLSLA